MSLIGKPVQQTLVLFSGFTDPRSSVTGSSLSTGSVDLGLPVIQFVKGQLQAASSEP